MSVIEDEKLLSIRGGSTSITSSMVNAFTNVIRVLYDAGHSLGSAIRRIGEGNLCPLE
ncbi:MAG: hypothetical protein IJ193_01620 [Bacilli bacterium]|nr:hypothetical protein [Bacilli bacterium]